MTLYRNLLRTRQAGVDPGQFRSRVDAAIMIQVKTPRVRRAMLSMHATTVSRLREAIGVMQSRRSDQVPGQSRLRRVRPRPAIVQTASGR
ncbi:MAG: hypothetical protein JSS16_12920 [Proteobacteria bacterium]|nr:hypothetical protein [Pseudomonadota bacterium]